MCSNAVKTTGFDFSLIGRENGWLQCFPNDTIHTWKELEDIFLDRYFYNAQFVKRKAEILNFDQGDFESLFDELEKFKWLL